MLIPVLLAGGVGSRLWPVSRQLRPKQFLPLADADWSMLQQTSRRAQVAGAGTRTIVVCNEEHRFLVAEQMRQAGAGSLSIILEPEGKNTAPAAALAAIDALAASPDALLLVLPADHFIRDEAALRRAVEAAVPLADEGWLVTFGIVPTAPETGYGYIRRGEPNAGGAGYRVAHFAEKPDLERARGFVDSGEYYWNSGMFLFRADALLAELQAFAPAIRAACEAAHAGARADLDFIRVDATAFARCPADSIDYAVMEKTARAAVIPLDCGWSDVGSWSSLWDIDPRDADGNACHGDVMPIDSHNSYLRADSRLLATLGVDDLVVVETADAVLVARKDRVQDIKQIVAQLGARNRTELFTHTRVYRPWGSYETLVSSERFQVKRIVVNPGHQLSLQLHHHRAEHWVVVRGTARVNCGEREFMLAEDQSTYIPLGTRHRLANPGMIPLEIIEIQSGSYLGEDDIVRFEDVYGRSPA